MNGMNEKKEVLVVIDYQGCFLPGGGLATNLGNSPLTGDKDGKRMATELDTLIKTNKFSTVYFTKDMHHPDNVSITPGKAFTADPNFYKGRNITRRRDWGKDDARAMQVFWPRHCTIPPFNPFYSRFVSVKSLKELKPSGNNLPSIIVTPKKQGRMGYIIGSKINEFLPEGTAGERHYGAELPYSLEKYEAGKPEGITSDIVEVYKGFDVNTDSYSAISDALGNFTPFVAKVNGEFVNPNGVLEPFLDYLRNENPSDIYLTGIARDVCVYWTFMDILNFWVFAELKKGNTNVPKVHFLYDLTRPVGATPGGVLDKSKEDIVTSVNDLATVMGVSEQASNYFVVEDANVSTMSGGRKYTRRNNRKMSRKGCRKNHRHTKKCRTQRKRYNRR